MKPNLDQMSMAELRAYLLTHRHDDEAFYHLADRLEASSSDTELYPMPDTPETIALMAAAIQAQIKKLS